MVTEDRTTEPRVWGHGFLPNGLVRVHHYPSGLQLLVALDKALAPSHHAGSRRLYDRWLVENAYGEKVGR